MELIDARTLLPFDRAHRTVESLKKTNRLLVVDEDVPGGASAYLLKDMLRPMLKTWLDDNLPQLVERLVRAEIERVSRGFYISECLEYRP